MTKTKSALHPTRNNLPSNTKTVVIQLLNKRLADGLDIALITKQAHWNLKGPQFIGVHTMVDGFRTEQDTFNDEMAERITALGGTAYGTSQAITDTSSITPYPTDIYNVEDHIKALIERYATFANAIRQAIDEADEAGDADTADLFTGISRAMDKQLWFLEAHMPVTSK
ncbi:DNA starvation/stationary phase protection protein Dps [Commensalibacter oyaizuii]|uniref:DNA starvation/stationary phase protection protein Dps n=1 Tax=Commensalibacter oyaizuii TaxID=3043873 RepID=A0ABT6Q191_9PROT|nr:DNA starvation/stationary phase protection protein Dps [Commensalibacter sp. TBRC 16381]MDI2090849.1 DNA starvation/stationary phase protection protein Dps [Commensalibacter sp. TBRC 16381]